VGFLVGVGVGLTVGELVGLLVGAAVGVAVGAGVGKTPARPKSLAFKLDPVPLVVETPQYVADSQKYFTPARAVEYSHST
jgi:hypothetical protein